MPVWIVDVKNADQGKEEGGEMNDKIDNSPINLMAQKIEQLEHDAMVIALRLMGEDDATFSPECHEAMKRWREKAQKYFLVACKRDE